MWSGFDGRHLWKEAGQEASRSLFHPEEFQVVHSTFTGTWYKPCPTPFFPRKLWALLLLQKLIKNARFARSYTAVKPRIFINWKLPRIPVLTGDVLHYISSPHSSVPRPYSWDRASLLLRSVMDTDNLQHAQAAQGPSTRSHRRWCCYIRWSSLEDSTHQWCLQDYWRKGAYTSMDDNKPLACGKVEYITQSDPSACGNRR